MRRDQKSLPEHPNLTFVDYCPQIEDFKAHVLRGLAKHPKEISSKFLYDKRGSELFDGICQQPEYYQTDSELEVLGTHARSIAASDGKPMLLFELGSGHSRKVRHLLEHLPAGSHFVPIDISGDYLLEHAGRIAAAFPHVNVTAICADFLQDIALSETLQAVSSRMAFFPGSTIGNFEPETQLRILRNVHALLGKGGRLVIGVDRKNAKPVLEAAYNDQAGVTAAFELNLLTRMNGELGADFDPRGFSYRGFYNADQGRVEMYLMSEKDQVVKIDDHHFSFARQESIHVENSYKYETEEFAAHAAKAGFAWTQTWTDTQRRFNVHLLESV